MNRSFNEILKMLYTYIFVKLVEVITCSNRNCLENHKFHASNHSLIPSRPEVALVALCQEFGRVTIGQLFMWGV